MNSSQKEHAYCNNASNNVQGVQKPNPEDRQFTFKIIKRRSPWTKSEDSAIISLVDKHGTGNWTIIATEMSNTFNFKNRSGKQCRERWHNHLDPNVNKDYWTEKEENILFSKHMEYGNKWSDIAKYLPGRTDNAIKNHFYSKLRKYIRKILKQINKENLMKANGVDSNKYNSDKIYKMLKKFKIDYKSLNKETVLGLIVNNEKNSGSNMNGSNKGSKGEIGMFIRTKTRRNRSGNNNNNNSTYLTIKDRNWNNGNVKDNNSALNANVDNGRKDNVVNSNNNNTVNGNYSQRKISANFAITQVKESRDKKNVRNGNNNSYTHSTSNSNVQRRPGLTINTNFSSTTIYDNVNNKNSKSKGKKAKDGNIIKNSNSDINNHYNKSKPHNITTIHNNSLTNRRKKTRTKTLSKTKLIPKTSTLHHNNNVFPNFITKTPIKKRKKTKRRKVSICISTPENKKEQIRKILPQRQFGFGNAKKTSRKCLNPKDLEPRSTDIEIVRPGFEFHNKCSVIIIHKILLNNYASISNNSSVNSNMVNMHTGGSAFTPVSQKAYNTNYNGNTNINDISNQHTKKVRPQININIINSSLPELTLSFNEPLIQSQQQHPSSNTYLTNCNNEDSRLFNYMESQPQISPMNVGGMMYYPQSTRNIFNIELPFFESTSAPFKSLPPPQYIIQTPKQNILNTSTPNNFISNKLPKSKISYDLNNFDTLYSNNNNAYEMNSNDNNDLASKLKPQIDLNLINSTANDFIENNTATFSNRNNSGNGSNNNTVQNNNSTINGYTPFHSNKAFQVGSVNSSTVFNLTPMSAFIPNSINSIGNANVK